MIEVIYDFHIMTFLLHFLKKTGKKFLFLGTSGNSEETQELGSAKFYSPGNRELKNGLRPNRRTLLEELCQCKFSRDPAMQK